MSPERSSLILSPELWTLSVPDPMDKSSGPTTSSSARVEPETTGPRDTILKVLSIYLASDQIYEGLD